MERNSSGSGMGLLMIVAGLLLLVAPSAAPLFLPLPHSLVTSAVFGVFGLALVGFGAYVLYVINLYVRVPANLALVRTGRGGLQVVTDGGIYVYPTVHEVRWVNLGSRRIVVERSDTDSLVTKDALRVHTRTEFYLRVPKDHKAVENAATTLGRAADDDQALADFLEDKLASTLRQVAQEMDFDELLRNREEFIKRVIGHLEDDLARNGLQLETVTISKLDQTPPSVLRPDENVIDARGLRKIAEIARDQAVQRTLIEQDAERNIKAEQVKTAQYVAQQDIFKAQAEADREKQIAQARAEQATAAARAEAEKQRASQIAQIEAEQATQLAQVEQQQQIAVANQERSKAEQQAEIDRQKAIELAARTRDIAIAEQEQKRAVAEAERLAAEAQRMAREQEVQTVQVTAEANRRKQQQVIAAQAETEQQKLRKQMDADVEAYALKAQAAAEQDAAAAQAQARIQQAEAERQAKELEAQGLRAVQLVPVQVSKEQVEVEQARQMIPVQVAQQNVDVEKAMVEVRRQDLANQAEFDKIARELRIALERIAAEKEVGIAQAQAVGVALSGAHMQVYGDPSTVARLLDSLSRGQQFGSLLGGFTDSAPKPLVQVTGEFARSVSRLLQQKLGFPIDPDLVQQYLDEAAQSAAASPQPAAANGSATIDGSATVNAASAANGATTTRKD